MVRATLAGMKTQTRRVVTRANSYVNGSRANQVSWARLDLASPEIFVDPGPSPAGNAGPYLHVPRRDDDSRHRVYPQLALGDRLWVRETWCETELGCGEPTDGTPVIAYRADDEAIPIGRKIDTEEDYLIREWRTHHTHLDKWRSPIHMPRWASRILLEITDARVQRVQEISEEDAIAEGVGKDCPVGYIPAWQRAPHSYCFAQLWDSINEPCGFGWDENPWVWALTFRVVK
jgi:hypothetical protein